jgi:hypothetical protein
LAKTLLMRRGDVDPATRRLLGLNA